MGKRILVINPGSTSTRIGLYDDESELWSESLSHPTEVIARFGSIREQFEFRRDALAHCLGAHGTQQNSIDCIMARGGMLRPLPGGVYAINEAMLFDLETTRYGEHASNLGAPLAMSISEQHGIRAYIADPVVVDELSDIARIAGHKLFTRKSIFHALNQKAIARRWCHENNLSYSRTVLIVAHLGGGVSVGLHMAGKVVDVNNALDGDGPISAERAGTLPAGDLVRLCFSRAYSQREVLKMLTGAGGLVSLAGTNSLKDIEARVQQGDGTASLLLDAYVYNIAKAVGALAAAACGKVDQILITGGAAHSLTITQKLSQMCNFIAHSTVYPGEGEMEALATAGLRVLTGEEEIKTY